MKKANRLIAVGAICVFVISLAACAPQQGGSDSSATTEASPASIVGYHEAVGSEVDMSLGMSFASCGQASPCHEGYEQIVEESEAMWEGIGQIGEANPHASHASNAYECADCHSETGDPVNQCNTCHDFESPDGWQDPDPSTSVYGVAATESLY